LIWILSSISLCCNDGSTSDCTCMDGCYSSYSFFYTLGGKEISSHWNQICFSGFGLSYFFLYRPKLIFWGILITFYFFINSF
jgi:hypothetical protein